MSTNIEMIRMQKLEEMNDSTWGSGKFHKRLVLVAVKLSGEITMEEKHALLSRAWKKTTDNGTMSLSGRDSCGRGLLLVFDSYVVEQLGFLKRLCHATRMLKAAITGNIHVGSGVRVIILK